MDDQAKKGMHSPTAGRRLPGWFRIRLSATPQAAVVRNVIDSNNLHTVCRSAACPNRTECWNSGTATFLILGNRCTRNCGFCSVPKGLPGSPDPDEPDRVAAAVSRLGLRYAVITSVTRDDLPDGGAGMFARTIAAIRSSSPGCRVEVLIPDFQGSSSALRTVLAEEPDILNHNLETVSSLYQLVRPQAGYQRSLNLLARAAGFGAVTKTGLMLGLGEGRDEVLSVLADIRRTGCSILTLGQYLRPQKDRLPVQKYYHPEEFAELEERARGLGFGRVVAGPLVRSSYHAGEYGSQAAPPSKRRNAP